MNRNATRQAISPTEVYAETAEKHELITSLPVTHRDEAARSLLGTRGLVKVESALNAGSRSSSTRMPYPAKSSEFQKHPRETAPVGNNRKPRE
jgi:hypothetical protein